MRIWRINMTTRSFRSEETPSAWTRHGGRALLTKILLDEIDPRCDPLGPENKLIFAPGLLVGYRLSSCDRISVGGKSPLTNGIKESNAGGRTGLQMAMLGIKALIIEGLPDDAGWWLLHLSSDGAAFEKADDLAGLGVYESAGLLLERYEDKVAAALIGPAGEMLLKSAGVQNLDKDRVPSRIAARGGLGALMGSKRLKAIVIDGSGGSYPPAHDPGALRETRKRYLKALMDHVQTGVYRDYGTAAMTMMCDTFGALPTRGFSSGSFEGAEKLSGENLRQTLLKRGGDCDPSHPCMTGCAIQSSNVYVTGEQDTKVSPLEYETIGLMGSNLGIDDLDVVARLNYEANDLGVDTIEVGAALGVAAEGGLLEFGDGDRALELLAEIRRGSETGRMLGNGAQATGLALGVERIPTVKGQAMSAYDPRAIKGTGVTYATSPQGADHTCGLTIRANIDHRDPNGQKELSLGKQVAMAGYDSLGACIFAGFGYAADKSVIPALLEAIYGWEPDPDALNHIGEECLKLERAFNHRAGFTREDDRLPAWMAREPLAPHNAVFDVPDEDLDSVFPWA